MPVQARERIPSIIPEIETNVDAHIALCEGEIKYYRDEIKKANKVKRTIDRIEDQLDDLPLLNGIDKKETEELATTTKESA